MRRAQELIESSAEAELLAPANSADVLRAVCVLISQNEGTEASRALASLLRALYLDTSSFNFATLDCLGPVNRRYAERLISARLWDAFDLEEWEQAYDLVSNYEFAQGDPILARPHEISAVEEARVEALETADRVESPFSKDRRAPLSSAGLTLLKQAASVIAKSPAGNPRADAMRLLNDKLMYSVVLAIVAILIFILV
jgi:hypothetical protein